MRATVVRLAIVSGLFAIGTAPTLAQPVRIGPLQGSPPPRMDSSAALRGHGVHQVAPQMLSPTHARLELFGVQGEGVGAVDSIQVNASQQRFSIRLAVGASASLDVLTIDRPGMKTIEASTSEGGRWSARIEYMTSKSGPVGKPKAVTFRAGDGPWATLSMTAVPRGSEEAVGRTNAARQSEDRTLFSGRELSMLRAAIGFMSGDRSTLTPQMAASAPGAAASVVAVANRQCSARCFRQTTLLPIFICDDGFWNNCYCSSSQGWWYLWDCLSFLWCNQGCGGFEGPFHQTAKSAPVPGPQMPSLRSLLAMSGPVPGALSTEQCSPGEP